MGNLGNKMVLVRYRLKFLSPFIDAEERGKFVRMSCMPIWRV